VCDWGDDDRIDGSCGNVDDDCEDVNHDDGDRDGGDHVVMVVVIMVD
jgi:hypothetical protein